MTGTALADAPDGSDLALDRSKTVKVLLTDD